MWWVRWETLGGSIRYRCFALAYLASVLGECVKAQELYGVYCPFNFIIVIYESNCAGGLNEDQMKILLHHELLHIGAKESQDGPKFYIVPHDAEEFREIIKLYGVGWAVVDGGEATT